MLTLLLAAAGFLMQGIVAQDTCLYGTVTMIQLWIIECPVSINMVFTSDTIITFPGGGTIVVTHAPTSINTVITLTSTSTTTVSDLGGSDLAPPATSTLNLDSESETSTSSSRTAPTSPPPNTIPTPFNLYIMSNLSEINGLAVGEGYNAALVTEGYTASTTFIITSTNSLVDAAGNFVYFNLRTPSASFTRFLPKRQSLDDGLLQFGHSIPPGAVSDGFTLDGAVLRISTPTESVTPYLCSDQPSVQRIFVGNPGSIPDGCFSVVLVTNVFPPPSPPTLSGEETGPTATTSKPSSSTTFSISSTSSSSTLSVTASSTVSSSLSSVSTSTAPNLSSQGPTSLSTRTIASRSSSADLLASATSIIEQSSLQPFCSTLLGFTTPTVTATSLSTLTVSTTATVTSGTVLVSQTVTQTFYTTVPSTITTTTTTPVTTLTVTTTGVPPHGPGTARAIGTPPPLATFPPDIITSACSLEATPVTITATTTQSQTTQFTTTSSTTVPLSVNQTVTVTTIITTSSGGFTITVTASPSTTTATIDIAPTGYLEVDNSGLVYGASGSAGYLITVINGNDHEIYTVTLEGQLYSSLVGAYYYEKKDSAGDTLFYWTTSSSMGATTFYTAELDDGRQEVFFLNATTGTEGRWCVASFPDNSANAIGDCDGFTSQFAQQVRLYLQPT